MEPDQGYIVEKRRANLRSKVWNMIEGMLCNIENATYDFIDMHEVGDEDPFVRRFETFFGEFLDQMYAFRQDLQRGTIE